MNIPKSVSSLKFEECDFLSPIEISGLEEGRGVIFTNCRKNFLLGNIKLKNMACRTFELNQNDTTGLIEKLSPEINGCTFHNSIFETSSLPTFIDSEFIDKFKVYKITGNQHTDEEGENMEHSEHLYFEGCTFHNHTEINIDYISKLSLSLIDCKVDNTEDKSHARLTMPDKSYLKKFSYKNSKIKKLNFNFFMSSIENINIENSEIGKLEASTIESDEGNANYNIVIINSEVNDLSLRYRDVIHELTLLNTLFKNPPQLFGASISGSSHFPSGKFFESKNGEHDASCYRALRYFMESQRNRDMEGVFFLLNNKAFLTEKIKSIKYSALAIYIFCSLTTAQITEGHYLYFSFHCQHSLYFIHC